MTEAKIRELLASVAARRLTTDQAYERLRHLPFEDLGFARIDNHRSIRRGVPEVVFGDGKSVEQITAIGRRMIAAQVNLIVTRLSDDKARAIKRKLRALDYRADARIGLVISETPEIRGHGVVAVLSAGTSDMLIAEEAALCAELFGNRVERLYDVGVAGIHRLMAQSELLDDASVLIVVAGMEGALPSVVAGMVDKPVIAVPTSIGYGVALGGLAALFGMLNSCAGGVTVVNIDNGFGAALAATLINRVGLSLSHSNGRTKDAHQRTRAPRD
jgi:NCAIR mutase (PurE)-related protein